MDATPLPMAILVRPEALRTMATFAAASGNVETGGPLVGTVQRSWDGSEARLIVSVLGTVTPGPGLDGRVGSVALGRAGDGERAASAIRWWRSVTGLPLVHLGDWHKHVWGAPEPSVGDRRTARRVHAESPAGVWLTAIAVGGVRRTRRLEAGGNLARYEAAWTSSGEMRFYREAGRAGLVPVNVKIEAEAIPGLPALPWHVADPARFAAECRLLRAAGFTTAIEPTAGAHRPGVTIQLRRDGTEPLILSTGPRYPMEAPAVLDGHGRFVPSRDRWSPSRFLVDLAKEARG